MLKICETLRVVSPVGLRSKKSTGSASKRWNTCNDNRASISRRSDFDDFAPGVAQEAFHSRLRDENQRDHAQRRQRLVSDHPVDCDHNEERRQDLQDAQADRSGGDLPKAPALLEHEARDPGEGKGLLLSGRSSLAAHEHRPMPHVCEAKLIDRDGLVAGTAWILQIHEASVSVARDEDAGTAVGEQEHQRRVRLHPHELPPTQARRLGPQSVFARPGDKSGGRGHLAGRSAEFTPVEVDPMVPRDSDERGHTRLSRVPLAFVFGRFIAAEQAKRVWKMDVRSESTKQLHSRFASALDGMHKKATPSCANSIRH